MDMALYKYDLGFRREEEAAQIWVWMRWPKRRLQKAKGIITENYRRPAFGSKGKGSSKKRDASGKGPGGSTNSNDQEKGVTKSKMLIP